VADDHDHVPRRTPEEIDVTTETRVCREALLVLPLSFGEIKHTDLFFLEYLP